MWLLLLLRLRGGGGWEGGVKRGGASAIGHCPGSLRLVLVMLLLLLLSRLLMIAAWSLSRIAVSVCALSRILLLLLAVVLRMLRIMLTREWIRATRLRSLTRRRCISVLHPRRPGHLSVQQPIIKPDGLAQLVMHRHQHPLSPSSLVQTTRHFGSRSSCPIVECLRCVVRHRRGAVVPCLCVLGCDALGEGEEGVDVLRR